MRELRWRYSPLILTSHLFGSSFRWVGNTESMSGVVALLVAAPVGIVVDKYSRSKICKARKKNTSRKLTAAVTIIQFTKREKQQELLSGGGSG